MSLRKMVFWVGSAAVMFFSSLFKQSCEIRCRKKNMDTYGYGLWFLIHVLVEASELWVS